MSKLETLVPPPELCRRIPVGKFADSALVWTQGVDGMFIDFRNARPEDEEGNLPAPTLEEILEELRRAEFTTALFTCGDTWMLKTLKHNKTVFERDDNPAVAALRLWLEAERTK